jgi:glycosyltransferase involved in cell wall biosynthesis
MPEPARILYVQPNSEVGGSDLCLVRLFRALDQSRFKPFVVLPHDGPMVSLYKKAGATVLFSPMMQLRTLPSPTYQARYLASFWSSVGKLKRLIKEHQIDLVHTNSLFCLYGAWAARAARCRHVWHIREIPPAIPVARWVYAKMVLRLSDLIIPMTQSCGHGLFGKRLDNPKFQFLHDAIDLQEFGPHISGQRIRSELQIPDGTLLVGFVARLDPWKGLNVFIEAAAIVSKQFPQAKFIIAGGAPAGFEQHERQMNQLCQRLGLTDRVLFLGFKYRILDIPEVMSALDVFCHTSIRPEPFGLVLIEAMACARPVVAAAAGGPLEIVIDGETGFLTAPGSAEAHAKAVCRLLADPNRAIAMGAAGRRRAESHFSLEQFGEKINAIYDKLLFHSAGDMQR